MLNLSHFPPTTELNGQLVRVILLKYLGDNDMNTHYLRNTNGRPSEIEVRPGSAPINDQRKEAIFEAIEKSWPMDITDDRILKVSWACFFAFL